MIPIQAIQFNSDQLVSDLGITLDQARELIDYTVKEISANFAREWETTAVRKLKGVREEYVESIKVVDKGYARGAVVLIGWLPNAIESGHAPIDLKSGLLNGGNAKMSADGESIYNTVPFRFAASDSIGESPVFTGKLPFDVHEAIKAKPMVVPVVGGGIKTEPLQAKEIPIAYAEKKLVSVPTITPTPLSWKGYYQHKSSIYQGISKVQDPKTNQMRYMSFRRVSTNSEPEAFIHPGFSARNLAEEALGNINLEVATGLAVDDFLIKIGWDQ
jgi:hypothetical protein